MEKFFLRNVLKPKIALSSLEGRQALLPLLPVGLKVLQVEGENLGGLVGEGDNEAGVAQFGWERAISDLPCLVDGTAVGGKLQRGIVEALDAALGAIARLPVK